jgi:hypothetical protein
VQRVVVTLHPEAVGQDHLDDEDEQAHADDEGHDLEERQARARPGHIGDLG